MKDPGVSSPQAQILGNQEPKHCQEWGGGAGKHQEQDKVQSKAF